MDQEERSEFDPFALPHSVPLLISPPLCPPPLLPAFGPNLESQPNLLRRRPIVTGPQ